MAGVFIRSESGEFGEMPSLVDKRVSLARVELAGIWGCAFDKIALFLVAPPPAEGVEPQEPAPAQVAAALADERSKLGATAKLQGGSFIVAKVPSPLGENPVWGRWFCGGAAFASVVGSRPRRARPLPLSLAGGAADAAAAAGEWL